MEIQGICVEVKKLEICSHYTNRNFLYPHTRNVGEACEIQGRSFFTRTWTHVTETMDLGNQSNSLVINII